ncbi:MAG: ATP synthase F0 subunit B [Desulfosarcinaceae bacterium]|nr:ATP synthase F0 subunit B [Desulfosarcinaceae bacterium]
MQLTNGRGYLIHTGGWLLVVLLGLHMTGGLAHAAEGGWRPVYDLAMRWFNFLLLAGVIIRYARQPVKNFLQARSAEVRIEIDLLEEQKAEAVAAVSALRQRLADSEARLAEMKSRLLADGERRKQALLDQAEMESAMMIRDAERKIEGLLHHAQRTLRAELVDGAIDLALTRMPAEIQAEDHQRLTADFFQAAGAT